DDAAGQAIANRMTSQVKGLNQAQRNANDGISIAQTAEGGLNQINENLQRIRVLTVQAQNGTNSASDIDSIQQEVNQRLEEIDRVAKQTQFNGINILSNSGAATNVNIQVGANDKETIQITVAKNSDWNKYTTASAAGATGGIIVSGGGAATRSVGTQGIDVLASGGTVLADIDKAIKAVDNQRSNLGAIQNRFESTIANL